MFSQKVQAQPVGWYFAPGSPLRRLIPLVEENGVLMPAPGSIPELYSNDEAGLPVGHVVHTVTMMISPN